MSHEADDRNAASSGPLAGLRVLIVEDETLVSMLLEDMVAGFGGRLAASLSRVDRALDFLRTDWALIDLAILDVNLGGEEVFPVAEVLVDRDIPFVFSTGYGSSGLPEAWRGRPILPKPFVEEGVRQVLERVLSLRAGAGS